MWNVPDINAIKYFSIVDEALTNDELFKIFKRNHDYYSIVGMSCQSEAEWMIGKLKDNDDISLNIEKFKRNDTIGDPELFESKEYGLISANTVRYINSLQNIQKHIGSLHGKDIVEIGVGYGGLCYILSTFYNIKSYRLVDVPNVALLAVKYLRALGLNTSLVTERSIEINFDHKTSVIPKHFDTHLTPSIVDTISENGREPRVDFVNPSVSNTLNHSLDLFISEYCISEMDDDGIDHFYENYIQRSKNIYIFSNLWDKKRKEQFLSKLGEKFNLTVFDDPLPHETKICPEKMNYIIMGKRRL